MYISTDHSVVPLEITKLMAAAVLWDLLLHLAYVYHIIASSSVCRDRASINHLSSIIRCFVDSHEAYGSCCVAGAAAAVGPSRHGCSRTGTTAPAGEIYATCHSHHFFVAAQQVRDPARACSVAYQRRPAD